ncbi:DUF6193 family natural product biosynthesis protein [Kitasatospora sp. NPDC088346]|uniref:DUF6193 family natural product biosynthesis protein n=1 Tax=Kitasatospora sp. NPDC088346 TaxID=3364073 RepID=UPI0037F21E41
MIPSSSGPVPDLALPAGTPATGSLTDRLSRTATELGLGLPAPEDGSAFRCVFEGADGDRVVVRDLREECRRLCVRFHRQGAWLADGRTADLAAVVRAAAAWTAGAGLERTRAAAPFVRFGDWALAHEREPLGPVELAWWHKLDSFRLPPLARHANALAVVEAAHAQPRLRQLMPATSHFMLWLSTVEHPRVRVGHSVEPQADGRFFLRDRGTVLASTATAEEAVALVVAALPEDVGDPTPIM